MTSSRLMLETPNRAEREGSSKKIIVSDPERAPGTSSPSSEPSSRDADENLSEVGS